MRTTGSVQGCCALVVEVEAAKGDVVGWRVCMNTNGRQQQWQNNNASPATPAADASSR